MKNEHQNPHVKTSYLCNKANNMSAISLDKEIQQYLPLLDTGEKQSLLSQIKSLLATKHTEPKMSREDYIKQYNQELNEAEKRVAAGFFTTQEDLEKESENW